MFFGKFRLKRIRQKAIIIGSVCITATIIGFSGYQIINSINTANASEQSTFEKLTGGYVFEEIPDINLNPQTDTPLRGNISSGNSLIGTSSYPGSYDSRSLGYVSRQENQAGENICWAYSLTTATESYLLRKGLVSSAIELSPKQLDYALAPASEAFSDSNENKYEDFVYNEISGKTSHRRLTDGSNFMSALVVTSGKYSLVEENTFFSKMKSNDFSTLGSFNSYGDFIANRYTLARNDYLAHGSTNLPLNYTVKQKRSDVFDRGSAKYAITGAEFINLGDYGDNSQNRTNAIARIKSDIMDYGAVAIASHYNEKNCVEKNGNNYTIIDRRSSSSNVCEADGPSGHGMTLVGWDDNWVYEDNGVEKTGAFIVQNTYGDNGINYYFSYDSYALATAVTNVEPSNSYDDIFDVSDAIKTVNPDQHEVIFDFPVNGRRVLKEIAVSVVPITNASSFGYDIYVKSEGEQYQKVGRTQDNGITMVNLQNINGIDKHLKNGFSIKIKYDETFNIGLSSEIFQGIAPYIIATAYTNRDVSEEQAQELPTHTLTLDPSGGSGDVQSLTCQPQSVDGTCSVTIPNTTPRRPGFGFFGYDTTKDSHQSSYKPGDNYTFATSSTNLNVTLYAQWANGTVIWADGDDHVIGVVEDFSIRIDYPMEYFKQVNLDGEKVGDSYYKVESGSTIVTLYSSYLDTLPAGEHSVQVLFSNDEVVEKNLTIASKTVDEGKSDPTKDLAKNEDKPTPISSPVGDSKAPETGSNTNTDSGALSIRIYLVPAVIIFVTISYFVFRHRRHVKFN